MEYAVDEVAGNNNGNNDVEVLADEVVPQNLANRGGRPAVSRRNNMVSFQDSLNSQWRAEQQQREADREDDRLRWERQVAERRESERIRREDDDRRGRLRREEMEIRQQSMNSMLTTALTALATAFANRNNN